MEKWWLSCERSLPFWPLVFDCKGDYRQIEKILRVAVVNPYKPGVLFMGHRQTE